METVRMDKWLWAARFFKTRGLAARACEIGRIESNSQKSKPSRDVKAGDMLRVKCEAGEFEIEVMGVSEMRGPATVAQTLYRETEASQEAKRLAVEQRKALTSLEAMGEGRPSKKDRREIARLRGR